MKKRGPLSPAEHQQRQEAAQASAEHRRGRHHAETAPSVRQGSSGAPSRSAVGLFRQGQQRPDSRGGRGVWDTRATEATMGQIRATVRFHFPEAYRSDTPDPAIASSPTRPPLVMTLGDTQTQRNKALRRKGRTPPPRGLTISNPQEVVEALRHPAMRQIMVHTVGVVRDHQKGTIERGQARGLIPEGTHPSAAVLAYRHAALRALHKAGIFDYDHEKMDEVTKKTLRPLNRFMFYAHRRVFDHLNQPPLQGKWDAFRQEFGQLYVQRKHGKETGHTRMRMRPVHEFIKIEVGGDLDLAKAVADAQRGKKLRRHPHVPELPHGPPPIAGAHVHLKDAAAAVEAHFGCPPIGGMTRKQEDGTFLVLRKSTFASSNEAAKTDMAKQLYSDSFLLGDFNTDPSRQLNRVMRPRIRTRQKRLRLGSRGLRRVLTGNISHQERWLLGSSSRTPDLGKGIIGSAARWGAGVFSRIAGSAARRAAETNAGRAAANLAARPRLARAILEARTHGLAGFLAPGRTAGRMAGAAINPKTIGALGGVGLAADFAPQAYTAAHLAGYGSHPDNRSTRQGSKPGFKLPSAMPLSAGKKQPPTTLSKISLSSAAKLGAAAAAGAGAHHIYRDWKESPRTRAVVGSLALGLPAAVALRGRTRVGVLRATRAAFHAGMQATPGRTGKLAALHRAQAARKAGLRVLKVPRVRTIAGTAAAGLTGAGLGVISSRHKVTDLPPYAPAQ